MASIRFCRFRVRPNAGSWDVTHTGVFGHTLYNHDRWYGPLKLHPLFQLSTCVNSTLACKWAFGKHERQRDPLLEFLDCLWLVSFSTTERLFNKVQILHKAETVLI